MTFDSTEQKALCVKLILASKVETDVAGLLAGASDGVIALLKAIEEAPVIPPREEKGDV